MIFRDAQTNDLPMLLEWRNDIVSRMSSQNNKIVKKEEHEQWFYSALKNKDHKLIIAELDGVAIGIVRLNYIDGICEISWTISPDMRGKGMGKKVVESVSKNIEIPIFAKILAGNIASIKIAEYIGLKIYKKINNMLVYSNIKSVNS